MTALSWLAALALMLGVLISVHEFGHFLAAKLCRVRVLKFSLGFGSPIGFGRYRMAWRLGETEYVIAWLPLGGFVKMLGENPDEEAEAGAGPEADRAFPARPVWQRLLIVFAGPVMNLLLPVVAFVVMLGVGLPRPAPVIGSVEPGSPAARAGLEPGDRIVAVAGRRVRWWDDVETILRSHPGESITIELQRRGAEGGRATVRLAVEARPGVDEFGVPRKVGWAGVRHSRVRAVVGILDSRSPAVRAGLRSGDRVVALAGEPIEDWGAFARRYAEAPGPRVEAEVERVRGERVERLRLELPALGSVEALGVIPAAVSLGEITPGSPAERAGLRPGDLVLAVNGEPVGSFASFAETVRASEGRPLRILYARDGKTHEVVVRAELTEAESGYGVPERRYLIGVRAQASALPGRMRIDREVNPLRSVPRAVGMTVEVTRVFLVGLGKLVTGQLSPRQLAGPIGIAEIAHDAMQRGWEVFLSRLILISINLGILNLLPIPVLDGGQALMIAIEGVKRSPISLRTREIAQQIGFTVLALLMGLALWNDLARRWSQLVDWVRHSLGS